MKKAIVIFSGGQDSTTCLVQAIAHYGRKQVETIAFDYGQRHALELEKAARIAADLQVMHTVITTSVIQQTTENALIDDRETIIQSNGKGYPNTFVDGRNALFLLLAACHAKRKGIHDIIIGVSQTDYSGYPDCRDPFIQSMNLSLNLAMDYSFTIKTPLMHLTKAETWALADRLGYLEYVQSHTHTCYMGVEGGCHTCPSCVLREKGLDHYLSSRNKAFL